MARLDQLQWDERYELGHPVLDMQHQKLLSLCNDAARCLDEEAETSRARFHVVLNDLMAYVNSHFKTEESLLEASAGEPCADHQLEHEWFREQLMNFLWEATFGRVDQEGLSTFLAAWWETHVVETDLPFFRNFGGSAETPTARNGLKINFGMNSV